MSMTQTSMIRSASEQAELSLEVGRDLIVRAREEQAPGLYGEAEQHLRAAVHRFEGLELLDRMAQAQDALANCYWRQGQTDKARRVLRVAMALLPARYDVERVMLTITLCQVERMSERYDSARGLALNISPLVEAVDDPLLRARFHSEYANALNLLEDHDCAIIEYTAASIYFEIANHLRHQAATDNNLAYLLVKANRAGEAHDCLNRAQRYYKSVGDKSGLAQTNETRARAYEVAEQLDAALEVVEISIRLLEGGEEKGLLEESRRTRERILASMGIISEQAKPPWQRLRLVTSCENEAARKETGDIQVFTCNIGKDDRSLVNLGPRFAPGSELTFAPADGAPDGALALIKVVATGVHHAGFYKRNADGSVSISFANSDAGDPYEPMHFPSRAEIEVVGILWPHMKR